MALLLVSYRDLVLPMIDETSPSHEPNYVMPVDLLCCVVCCVLLICCVVVSICCVVLCCVDLLNVKRDD